MAGMTLPDRLRDPASTDQLLSFTLPERQARGRIVRMGPVLGRILASHNYPFAIKQLLAEALVLAGLMGALLKREGSQLTLQAQAEGGAVDLLVCDYRDGEIRGYAKFDEDRVAELGEEPSLVDLFGNGYLAVTFDLAATDERYQGVVALEGSSLTEAVQSYFTLSEQLPTMIRIAVDLRKSIPVAGGMLVQHLAEGEEGGPRLHARLEHPEWDHVAIMAASVRPDELVNVDLPLSDLLWRLFHEEAEVRVQPVSTLTRGCRCAVIHFEEVLARFSADDRRDMRNDDGIILVDCAFCSREFEIQD